MWTTLCDVLFCTILGYSFMKPRRSLTGSFEQLKADQLEPHIEPCEPMCNLPVPFATGSDRGLCTLSSNTQDKS